MYATADDPNEKAFSWDTDGIPFVVDNSATAIISNKRRFFHGHLTPTRVTLETADRVSTKTQIVGICRLVLTDNKIKLHIWCAWLHVRSSHSHQHSWCTCPFANAGSPYDEDGTTIKLGATRLHFIWDHGKHERNFMHGSRLMPDLHLYIGHGYFNAFCTRIHKLLRDSHQLTWLTQAPPPLNLMSFPQILLASSGDRKRQE